MKVQIEIETGTVELPYDYTVIAVSVQTLTELTFTGLTADEVDVLVPILYKYDPLIKHITAGAADSFIDTTEEC